MIITLMKTGITCLSGQETNVSNNHTTDGKCCLDGRKLSCPECGAAIIPQGKCEYCPVCGFSTCDI